MSMKPWLIRVALLLTTAGIIFALLVLRVQSTLLTHRVHLDALATSTRPVIVLGASVKRDGTPSDVLIDRVKAGVRLYQEQKAGWILMSGDDGKFHTDEVSAMQALAMNLGVPKEAIKTDGQGYRTYESCKRARDIFQITEATIITQSFHLGRALYLCNSLGIRTQGMTSDFQSYEKEYFFLGRDILASIKALWDIHIQPPRPPVRSYNGP